jgi:signal transduction histidine kinase/CheY-like chemotaxis protein
VVPPHDQPEALDAIQLRRRLADALEQRLATSEVLELIGRPSFELEPVFETVARHALRLCNADVGVVWRLDGDSYRVAHMLGGSPEYRALLARTPVPATPGTMVGRVGLERRVVRIRDALRDPAYEWHQALELGGARSMVGVPMLAGNRVVGVISLHRTWYEPFDARTIEVLTTFAAQGAIAIQNVHLFRALELRERDLAASVGELRALGEIGQAVTSSLDVDHVLSTIVTRAVELSDTEGGSIFDLDTATGLFHLRACHGTGADLVDRLRQTRIHLDETFVGRGATSGAPTQIADLREAPGDVHLDALREAGWLSILAVPLLREREIIGALVVRRTVPGAFSDGVVDLMETLASQSAVAIHNARLFRALEGKTLELEVASRHKTEFLASMSHELRTPLNAVIGFSDVLLERMFGDVNERQEEYLRDIRDSGRHLLELINEILDLSKVEAGRMELEPARVSLVAVLEHGLSMVREHAAQRDVTLQLEVEPGLEDVWADELRLKQVVLNLLTNAVKFNVDGGAVDVRARVDGDDALVTVHDTGPGIPAAERERIFEAFQRGGRSARTTTEGTGLGLTLSRRIVELHGGRLWLEDGDGGGSTFAFVVPLAPTRAVAGDESPPDPDRPAVLVVEDDARSADLLRVYLEDAGFTVRVAADGEDGVRLARSVLPAAVLLDVLLPRLDGWDVLAHLKADAATAGLPVVIVSMLDERGKAFALGAADYLVKPVGREEVLDALHRCMAAPDVRRTVVVIDDDPVDLDLVEASLGPEGYSVLRATTGEHGLELVRREQPAVVLVDLLMPGLDGFAVVERLKADPATADIPVVVLTAKDMTPDDRRRLAGQISHLAQKGAYGRAELVALVDAVARNGAKTGEARP